MAEPVRQAQLMRAAGYTVCAALTTAGSPSLTINSTDSRPRRHSCVSNSRSLVVSANAPRQSSTSKPPFAHAHRYQQHPFACGLRNAPPIAQINSIHTRHDIAGGIARCAAAQSAVALALRPRQWSLAKASRLRIRRTQSTTLRWLSPPTVRANSILVQTMPARSAPEQPISSTSAVAETRTCL